MKKLFISGLFALITFTAYSQQKINRLTLDDVIYIAQQQSPDALIAKHSFRSSYWEYRSFRAGYLPSLNFSGTVPNFNRSIDPVTQDDGSIEYRQQNYMIVSGEVSLVQRLGFSGGQLFASSAVSRTDNLDTDFSGYSANPVNIGFQQPIFQYNAYRWQKKIEPLQYEEAKRAYLEKMEQVAKTATNVYFNLLLAQLEVHIAATNLANYDTLYNLALGRFQLGKIAENELLQLELNLLRAESAVDNAELNFENNLFVFKSFLRITDEAEILLIPPDNTYHFDVDVPKAIMEAKNNTARALEFERRLLEAKSQVAEARLERFDAELFAVYGLTQAASELDNLYADPVTQQDQQQLRIGINVPIVDWGVTKGRIKMAESMYELEETSVEQARVDFEQNIFLAVMRFNMQEKQLMIAAKADTVAQKRFDITQKRYMIGKVNDVLELNMAQVDRDSAKKGYFSALQTYWNAYYDLRRITLFDFRKNEEISFNPSNVLQ